MSRVTQLLIGAAIGMLCCLAGSWLFLMLFTDYGFNEGMAALRAQGNLGKLLSLGAVLSLAAFWALLKYNKELMARGVLLAMILLAIYTILL